ncbi:DUF4268 domain-containing protein [Formosa maritima]|uniref:DUF4268 domain-containing protein n=1 Tax=Formosa maritima TaxID=2592046 RepID=UPI0029390D9F|nr:DUF4268 domain-containing protein [Formosa maritima]
MENHFHENGFYNTKIKDFNFKIEADNKQALVCLDIKSTYRTKNELLSEQVLELKDILIEDFLLDVIFDEVYMLETGKIFQRIYVKYNGEFNIHNKNTWKTFIASLKMQCTSLKNFMKLTKILLSKLFLKTQFYI